MRYYKDWETEIMVSLYGQKVKGLVETFDFSFSPPMTEEESEKCVGKNLNSDFIAFYGLFNGLKLSWSAPNHIGGEIEFLKMKYVLQDWTDILFDKNDLDQNDLLEFYLPVCQLSETYSCGFLVTPEYVSNSIYCHNAPYTELTALNLDFNGFLKMAKASEIYHYWPKVLLDIQAKQDSSELEDLKTNLPLVFPEFHWSSYMDLFNSLRLTNSNKKD